MTCIHPRPGCGESCTDGRKNVKKGDEDGSTGSEIALQWEFLLM